MDDWFDDDFIDAEIAEFSASAPVVVAQATHAPLGYNANQQRIYRHYQNLMREQEDEETVILSYA